MSHSKIKTIVFDFGNVIGFFSYAPALKRLSSMASEGLHDLPARIIACGLEDDFESGRLTATEFLRRVRQLCAFSCSDEELAVAYSDIFFPNHEVCALLPRLKQSHRLLLASNTNELHAHQFTRQFATELSYFDHLVLSHQVGVRKPAAAFFQHCQELAHCWPDECLFIDDLSANVAAARRLGWHGIVYTDPTVLRAELVGYGIVDGETITGEQAARKPRA